MLEKKINFKSGRVGSALIMTIVLTALLAIVAVTFVMVARMDSASTSNIVDSKTLDNAAQSIIEIIGKELVFDTPGVANQEYQDYPDADDAWLASIEPYENGNEYYWRQISDVTGYLKERYGEDDIRNITVEPKGLNTSSVVREYPKFDIDENGNLLKINISGSTSLAPNGISADADGDGIADSKWIEFDGINTSKGKKVFAAIRIIDNCAMINVNTAYKFDADDPNNKEYKIDGTSQLQVNLEGLLKTGDDIDDFHKARCGSGDSSDWDTYDNDVIWQYGIPDSNIGYLPFDISDELELRYRYCTDSKFDSRIETDANISDAVDVYGEPGGLYDGSSNWGLPAWKSRIMDTNSTGNGDRRHLLTTYSFDRIIDPDGNKMWDVRNAPSGKTAQDLYNRLVGESGDAGCIERLEPNTLEELQKTNYRLAQIAANIVDYGDSDSNVSVLKDSGTHDKFYGYESPFIFISEVARRFKADKVTPSTIYRSYAVELYKNFDNDSNFNDNWRLTIGSLSPILLKSSDFDKQGGQYYVVIFQDPNAKLSTQYLDSPQNGAKNVSKFATLTWPVSRSLDNDGNYQDATSYILYINTNKSSVENGTAPQQPVSGTQFSLNDTGLESGKLYWRVDAVYSGLPTKKGEVWEFTIGTPSPDIRGAVGKLPVNTPILLERQANDGDWIQADVVALSPDLANDDGNVPPSADGSKSCQRDMRWNIYLKGLWSQNVLSLSLEPTLGYQNTWTYGKIDEIPPWHHRFTTTGDAAMVFYANAYVPQTDILSIRGASVAEAIGRKESEVRFDVNYPSMQNVFKYITALNPHNYASNDVNETRVRGRININTAPAFVISQLPWAGRANHHDLKIADTIVAYRDMTTIDGLNYSNRQTATGLDDKKYKVRTAPGFSSIGELMNVINDSGKEEYDIRYCGIDKKTQYGYPCLYGSLKNPDGNDTNVRDDLEEKEVIFARISDLATVRSDTFTAYILVRVGVDGPQKRFTAILDRTGVKKATDKVKVAAFQQVPAAR